MDLILLTQDNGINKKSMNRNKSSVILCVSGASSNMIFSVGQITMHFCYFLFVR